MAKTREEFVVEVVLQLVVSHLKGREGDVPKAGEEFKNLTPAWRQAAEVAADEFWPRGAYGR